VLDWIAQTQARWAAGQGYTWTIARTADQALLGQVGLTRQADARTWALAFWTQPMVWGQGFASEAAGRLVAFGFQELGATWVWAAAATYNHGSLRVLAKLGMVYQRDNPQGYLIADEPIPTKEFVLTRNAWTQRTRGTDAP
jgi:RimJ/RimL family protein N-acetyltransferase